MGRVVRLGGLFHLGLVYETRGSGIEKVICFGRGPFEEREVKKDLDGFTPLVVLVSY